MNNIGVINLCVKKDLRDYTKEVVNLADMSFFRDKTYYEQGLETLRELYSGKKETMWIDELNEVEKILNELLEMPRCKQNSKGNKAELFYACKSYLEFIQGIVDDLKSRGKSTLYLRQEGIDSRRFYYRGDCAIDETTDRFLNY